MINFPFKGISKFTFYQICQNVFQNFKKYENEMERENKLFDNWQLDLPYNFKTKKLPAMSQS